MNAGTLESFFSGLHNFARERCRRVDDHNMRARNFKVVRLIENQREFRAAEDQAVAAMVAHKHFCG